MTQEGQALPSPTPPESPVEPTTAATDPLTETPNQAEQDGKQHEGISDEEAEAHSVGGGRVEEKDAGGEGELQEEIEDGSGYEDQKTDGGAEGESEGMRGEGCINVEVSSVGEEAAHEAEEMKEEGKQNEETQPSTEKEGNDSQQAERLVD